MKRRLFSVGRFFVLPLNKSKTSLISHKHTVMIISLVKTIPSGNVVNGTPRLSLSNLGTLNTIKVVLSSVSILDLSSTSNESVKKSKGIVRFFDSFISSSGLGAETFIQQSFSMSSMEINPVSVDLDIFIIWLFPS